MPGAFTGRPHGYNTPSVSRHDIRPRGRWFDRPAGAILRARGAGFLVRPVGGNPSANLRHNVQEVRKRVGGRPILAVIKNNGYGLGVVNVARLLEPLPAVAGLAVVKLHEAMALRDAGIRRPILLMGPADERELEEAIARDIMPMVYTPVGRLVDAIAARRQKPVALHVCVDTGIGRVGVPHTRAAPLMRDLAGRKSVEITA